MADEQRYSVGFSLVMDEDTLDEITRMHGSLEANDKFIDEQMADALKEADKMFNSPVEITTWGDGNPALGINADAELKHWVDDLQAVADKIKANDEFHPEGIVTLNDWVTATDFWAVQGHVGRGHELIHYDRWADEFGVE